MRKLLKNMKNVRESKKIFKKSQRINYKIPLLNTGFGPQRRTCYNIKEGQQKKRTGSQGTPVKLSFSFTPVFLNTRQVGSGRFPVSCTLPGGFSARL